MIKISSKYVILKELGKGGFGTVYLAEHVDLGAKYAIKLLNKEISEDESLILRFKREAEVLMRLVHQNSIQLRDFGRTDDGLYYMAMDYCPGKSLKSILKEQGALSPEKVLELMIPILDVFELAHSMGIVHRDIKPENIMIEESPDGKEIPKVLDFGIAKLKLSSDQQKNTTITKEGSIIGTPLYMSPEQATAQELDHRSDLYSLGVVMYEMLTGTPPFSGGAITDILLKQCTSPPPTFEEVAPNLNLHPDFEAVVRKSLEKLKEDRFQSASEFRQALENLQAGRSPFGTAVVNRNTISEDISATRTSDRLAIPKVQPSSKSYKGLVFVLFFLLILCIPVIYFFYSAKGSKQKERSLPPQNVVKPVSKISPKIEEISLPPKFTKEAVIDIVGNVSHPEKALLFFQNRKIPLSSTGTFSIAKIKLREGRNSFLLVLKEDKKLLEEKKIEVIRDTLPPKILLDFPTSIYTQKESLTLTGRVEENHLHSLLYQGNPVSLSKGQTFAIHQKLSPNQGITLKLEAVDLAGNRSSQKIYLCRDIQAPKILLDFPKKKKIHTFKATLAIQGKVLDTSPLDFFRLNGKDLTYTSLSKSYAFQTTYSLSLGENVIQLKCRDRAGNIASLRLWVRRYLKVENYLQKIEHYLRSFQPQQARKILDKLFRSKNRRHLHQKDLVVLDAYRQKITRLKKHLDTFQVFLNCQGRKIPLFGPWKKITLSFPQGVDYLDYTISVQSKKKYPLYPYIFQVEDNGNRRKCWILITPSAKNSITPLQKKIYTFSLEDIQKKKSYSLICFFSRSQNNKDWQKKLKKTIQNLDPLLSKEQILEKLKSFFQGQKIEVYLVDISFS